LDTRSDELNVSAGLGFSSINMFGAMGYKPFFTFYQSDEFSHSLDVAVNIPLLYDWFHSDQLDKHVTWRVQSVLNAGFRGFSLGVVNFRNILTIRSNDYWTESLIAGWETPTKRSLLSILYDSSILYINKQNWFSDSIILKSSYEQLRRESLELTFDKSADFMKWNITLGHEQIIRILGRLHFTGFVKLRLNENLSTEIFTIDAIIGTTLRVSF